MDREQELGLQDGDDLDLSEIFGDLEDAAMNYKDDAQTTTRRLLRLDRPNVPAVHADWDVMRPALELANRTCGWD